MLVTLTIDNLDRLPDGGPLGYRSHERSFLIGRERCDWSLADPDRFISGRHCEVRYEAGAFWLHDLSRNGTFVNGSNQRISGPHRLGNGDRLRIGRYIISVALEDAPAASSAGTTPSAGGTTGGPRGAPSAAGRGDPTLHAVRPTRGGAAAGAGPQPGNPPASGQSRAPSVSSPPPTGPGPGEAVLRGIAAGAGIPPEMLLQRDHNEIAMEIGQVLRIVVDELATLLKARAAAKALARSGHRTMISAADNNPLKFVPGAEETLEIMFARRRSGYMDARTSVEDAFRDLKTHEFATYAAMQAALARLIEDLSPETIEKKLPASSFGLGKGRAWEAFVATWSAKEEAHENGMLDVFLGYFSEAYAKAAKQK